MTPRLRDALEATGSKPGDPWWIVAEEMANGSRALSPDDMRQLSRQVLNEVAAGMRQARRWEWGRAMAVRLACAAAVFVSGYIVGWLTE